jgi:Family of unknown function (DUF5681)
MKLMTFQTGQSGNPSCRPRGARGKATILAEGMFEGEAEAIIRAAIDLAKSGDAAAVRVCLDRIAPRVRHRAIAFELPPLHSAASALSALADIAAAVSSGDLTPAEADSLSKLVERYVHTLEDSELEQRVAKLEREVGIPAPKSNQTGQTNQNGQNRHNGHSGHDHQHNHGAEP